MATPPPPPSAPPPPPSAPPPPPAAAAPAKGGNRALTIILIILGVILLLIGGCAVACGLLVKKGYDKTKQYSAEAEKNPQLAAVSLAASLHPQIEIVSKDINAGVITLRNKKTGETVTLNVNNYNSDTAGKALEQFARGLQPSTGNASEATPSEEKSESAPAPAAASHPISAAQASAAKASLRKFPAEFPVYSGGGAATEEANVNSVGPASTYQHVFSTSDAPEEVSAFYQKKLTTAGYTQLASTAGSNDNGPTANAAFQRPDGHATFSIDAEIKDGKTHVEAHYLLLSK